MIIIPAEYVAELAGYSEVARTLNLTASSANLCSTREVFPKRRVHSYSTQRSGGQGLTLAPGQSRALAVLKSRIAQLYIRNSILLTIAGPGNLEERCYV